AGGDVEHRQRRGGGVADQRVAAVGGEDDADRETFAGERGQHLERVRIVHGDGVLAAVRHPYRAVGRDLDAFGALAGGALVGDAAFGQVHAHHSAGDDLAHVGDRPVARERDHVAEPVADVDRLHHLARVEVHLQQRLAALGGDEHVAIGQEADAVRTAVPAEIDGPQHRAGGDVDQCQRATGLLLAVIGDHGDTAV